MERRVEISSFEQGESETLYDVWGRFRLLLRKCPNPNMDNMEQMQHFTRGLKVQTRMPIVHVKRPR